MTPKTVYAFALQDIPDTLAVFSSLYRFPYTQMLNNMVSPDGQRTYSTIVFQPVEVIESWGNKVTVTNRDQQLTIRKNIDILLAERLEVWGHGKALNDPLLPPFQGGAIGYLGFGYNQDLPSVSQDVPAAAFGIYDQCVSFSHTENLAWYVVVADTPDQAQQKYAHFQRLASRSFLPPVDAVMPTLSWAPTRQPSEVKENVRRLTDYIHSGAFESGFFCQFFESRVPAGYDMLTHYRKLADGQPRACLNLGGLNIMVQSMDVVATIRNQQIEIPFITGKTRRPEGTLRDDVVAQTLAQDETAMASHRAFAKNMTAKLSSFCPAHGILGPTSPTVVSAGDDYQIQSITRGIMGGDTRPTDIIGLFSPSQTYGGVPTDRALRMVTGMEDCARDAAFGHMAVMGFDGSLQLIQNLNVLMNTGTILRYAEGAPITTETVPDAWYNQSMDSAWHTLGRWSAIDETEQHVLAG